MAPGPPRVGGREGEEEGRTEVPASGRGLRGSERREATGGLRRVRRKARAIPAIPAARGRLPRRERHLQGLLRRRRPLCEHLPEHLRRRRQGLRRLLPATFLDGRLHLLLHNNVLLRAATAAAGAADKAPTTAATENNKTTAAAARAAATEEKATAAAATTEGKSKAGAPKRGAAFACEAPSEADRGGEGQPAGEAADGADSPRRQGQPPPAPEIGQRPGALVDL
mmetsp:Transcript_36474/g.116920  ORF Transcript_36474/g.116920 Transcript_36474/m.116920 type:complete len:225 (+) Transcript_36474:272-946(+)